MTTRDAASSQPAGYTEPTPVWIVEYSDEREPANRFQLGAFTTEEEAQKLLGKAALEAPWASDWVINVVPVHQRLEDWDWDR